MKRKKLEEALNEINDRHIAEAANPRKKNRRLWLSAIAAVLAIIIFLNAGSIPGIIRAKAVSEAPEPRILERTDKNLDAWRAQRQQREAAATQAKAALSPFFSDSAGICLADSGSENLLYSPVNLYIGLSMAAELAGGESRQQILDAFGVADIDSLQAQASAVWETCYTDENNRCTLANSLWLDSSLEYSQDVMDSIAHHYYASVYQADLGTEATNKAIGTWLNNNTGGLLKNAADGINLDPETVLALYSTVYFYSKWQDEFSAKNNTQDTFHTPDGDITATFMNKKLSHMNYYWGDSFGAVSMGLKNGSYMWFILPDADKTVDDVLSDGQFMRMITDGYDPETYEEKWTNYKYMKVNLSVPKFDVSSQRNLKDGLEKLGITHIFDPDRSDFSDAVSGPVFLTAANQSVRVKIDEEGVEAVAYIEFPGAGAAAPPEEIIDFVLDRPFLFVISKSSIPLFAGVVNNP